MDLGERRDTRSATAVYGTLGMASASGVPGPRQGATSWIDGSGNLWLFGGYGYDSNGSLGDLNDLWKFSRPPDNGRGLAAPMWWQRGGIRTQNTRRHRQRAGGSLRRRLLIDSSGNLWLFGGYGYDSSGSLGDLNDL